MFSDHLRHINAGKNGIAGKVLLALGGLAIVGQLGAVAMVADGQVKKAELRASQAAAEQLAVRHCLESGAGATRHTCIQQARALREPGEAVTASLDTGIASSARLDAAVVSGSGFVVPVNFMAH